MGRDNHEWTRINTNGEGEGGSQIANRQRSKVRGPRSGLGVRVSTLECLATREEAFCETKPIGAWEEDPTDGLVRRCGFYKTKPLGRASVCHRIGTTDCLQESCVESGWWAGRRTGVVFTKRTHSWNGALLRPWSVSGPARSGRPRSWPFVSASGTDTRTWLRVTDPRSGGFWGSVQMRPPALEGPVSLFAEGGCAYAFVTAVGCANV